MKKETSPKKSLTKHKILESALMSFRHAMTEELGRVAKERGCSVSHFEVLKYIADKGSPSMKDIARELGITPPSASTLIDTLVSKQFVTRTQTPEDRRTIRIILQPKGNVLLSSVYKQKNSLFNKMLSKLSNEDKTELARILIKCS